MDRSGLRLRTEIIALILLLMAAGAGTASLAAADIRSAERTIEAPSAEPGESVNITVEIQLSGEGDRMSVDEFFEKPFGDVSIGNVTYNGELTTPTISLGDEEDGIVLGIAPEGGFESGDIVEISYEVTIPDDATDDETFRIDGESAIDDEQPFEHTGDVRVNVSTKKTNTPQATVPSNVDSTPGTDSDSPGAYTSA